MKGYLLILPLLFIVMMQACVHEPVLPQVSDPGDTISGPPTDTLPGDSIPLLPSCDQDTVYFTRDLLPLLVSNCAKSGCHDATTARDGVILTDYAQVLATADIDPGDPESSDLYEVLVEDDPDDKMPPAPNSPLSNDQILMIRTWILQGAQDLSCNDSSSLTCDTLAVSYSATIDPILTTYCKGCHNSSSASGGVNLNNHASTSGVANSGKLYGVVAHLDGFPKMPQGGNQLPDCEIRQIKAWIDAGALNN